MTSLDHPVFCEECRKSPPVFDFLISISDYGPEAKERILKAKYRKRYWISKCLGAQLAYYLAIREPWVIHSGALVIPVPLTFRKLLKRGFNQSAVMGKTLSSLAGLPHNPSGLKRVVEFTPQAGRDASMRKLLISHVFRINSLKAEMGKNIILVDDVATTLSTLNECASVIREYTGSGGTIVAVTVARSIL